RRDLGMTYLVISHDLTIIRYLCDRVLVMYLGRIVEDAPAGELFAAPQHPYTEAWLSSTPDARAKGEVMRIRLHSDVESAGAAPGCALAPRCHRATDECFVRPQRLEPIAPARLVACHRVSAGEVTLPSWLDTEPLARAWPHLRDGQHDAPRRARLLRGGGAPLHRRARLQGDQAPPAGTRGLAGVRGERRRVRMRRPSRRAG